MASIQIPSTAFVPCPAISFRNRRANRCMTCEHFHGVVDTMPNTPADVEVPFDRRYRIGCAHLVARRCISVEVESDDGA